MFCETGPSGMHPSICLHWINIYLDVRRAFLGCHLLDGYHIRRRTLEHCSPCSLPIQNNRGQESPGWSSSKPHRSNRPGKQFVYAIGSSNTNDEAKFLTLPHTDQKLFRRCSRLLYKICKARGILPASYVVQPELTHVGEIEWSGGFADVSKGEYRGRPVAIKHLRIRAKDEFDKVFKVSNPARLGTSQLFSFNLETLSRSSHLETLVPSECLASVGSVRV